MIIVQRCPKVKFAVFLYFLDWFLSFFLGHLQFLLSEICIGKDGPIKFYDFLHTNTNSTGGYDHRRTVEEENHKKCQSESGIPFIDFLAVENPN